MSFGEPGHANSKTAALRMRPRLIESANEFDQIDRMLERIPRFIVSNSCRPISATSGVFGGKNSNENVGEFARIMSVMCMTQRLPSFLPQLSVNSPKQLTARLQIVATRQQL